MATNIPNQLNYSELFIEDDDDVVFSEPLPPGSQILLFDVEDNQSVGTWSDVTCDGGAVAGSIVIGNLGRVRRLDCLAVNKQSPPETGRGRRETTTTHPEKKMTFAEALNDKACSCGIEEGSTWFVDGNGDAPEQIGEFKILQNNNGTDVREHDRGYWLQAEKDGEIVEAVFDRHDQTWTAGRN